MKNRFSENAVCKEWVIPFCLGGNDKGLGRVLLGGMNKNARIYFFDSKLWVSSLNTSNFNTINLKLFWNHGGIYKFEKKIKKYSGITNLLKVHRNTREYILEVNCEGLGW